MAQGTEDEILRRGRAEAWDQGALARAQTPDNVSVRDLNPYRSHVVAIWGCAHSSLSGIDTTPLDDPGKLWRCHECDEVLDQSGNVVPDADAYLRILADLRDGRAEVSR